MRAAKRRRLGRGPPEKEPGAELIVVSDDSSSDLLVLAKGEDKHDSSPVGRMDKTNTADAGKLAPLEDKKPVRDANRKNPLPPGGQAYTLVFKKGAYTKRYQLGAEDTLESVYDDILGPGDISRRLYSEGVPLSRFLSLSECSLFPGVNYIELSPDDDGPVKSLLSITLLLPGERRSETVSKEELVSALLERSGLEGVAVVNGRVLRAGDPAGECLEDGDVVDVVERKFLMA